jgi:aerobic carbon-monoxide dehydrogenase medium subunit
MKPAPFKYFAPARLEEAIELLAGDDQARPLAGGQSLVPMMNLRLARPSALVDINRIPGLSDIREINGALCIGSTTRQAALLASPVVRRLAPLMSDALAFVGHPSTRARGTIGGSIANADPAAELPVIALALNAEFVVRGADGERVIRAADFFRGMFETAARDGELLTEIRIAPRLPRSGHAFLEIARRHGDFAIVSVAVNLTVDDSDRCERSRIVLGGVGPIPVRCEAVEAQIQGHALNETTIGAVSDAIDARSVEFESRGASRQYRLHVARVLLKRALQQARHSARTYSR